MHPKPWKPRPIQFPPTPGTPIVQFQCESCQRTLAVPEGYKGSKLKCPCGKTVSVPQLAAEPVRVTVAPVQTSVARAKAIDVPSQISITCSCGRNLLAPASALGKAVRCPCGKPVRVVHAVAAPVMTTQAAPVVAPGPRLEELPRFHTPVHAPPLQPYDWSKHAQPMPSREPTSPPAIGSRSSAETYLENAARELRQRRSGEKGDASQALAGARIILFIVGTLVILIHLFLFLNASNEVDEVMRAGDAEVSRETLLLFCQFVYGCYILAGIGFLVLGALVYTFPLTATITGLVLYMAIVAADLCFSPISVLNPRSLVVKGLIIAGFIKAINNAAYYRD